MAKTQNTDAAQVEALQKVDTTHVEINLPSRIQIELVPANELRHYEVFLSLGSLFSSAAVGFWTAYLTPSSSSPVLRWTAIVFSLFTIVFVGVALYYRSKLKNGGVKRVTTFDSFK